MSNKPLTKERSLRQELTRKAECRRKMRESCKLYSPEPILGMTDAEIKALAGRVTTEAKGSMRIKDADGCSRRLNNMEAALFEAAIVAAVDYFNQREEEHRQILLFRKECQEQKDNLKELNIRQRKSFANFIVQIKS